MKCNVIVVGGAGFIGSHTCKELHKFGYRPIVVDNLSNGHSSAVKWGPLEQCDLSEQDKLLTIFKHYNPVGVLHFAARIEASTSIAYPTQFYKNNVSGTLSLLEVMERAGVPILVFSSTAAVYGNPSCSPITETHATVPLTPYGKSKLFTEEILHDISSTRTFRYIVFRYFNAAGADPDGELAERHIPETHLIPLALHAAYGWRSHFVVHGTDYDTRDGTCIRDFVHVSDLAKAHVLALEYLLHGGNNIIANLGTGSGYSVFEILQAVQQVVGRPIVKKIGPRRQGDPSILVADAALATRFLAWKPEYPNLSEIISHAHRSQFIDMDASQNADPSNNAQDPLSISEEK